VYARQKDHNEGIDNDLLTTNEKIGQLETTQIDTNNKLAGAEATVAHMDRSLSSFVPKFDEMYAKINGGYDESSKKTDCKKADGKKGDKKDESLEDNWADYVADTEQEDRDRRRLCTNRRGMGGFRRGREVHVKNDAFSKIKIKVPPFAG
jgi:phage shock protein A